MFPEDYEAFRITHEHLIQREATITDGIYKLWMGDAMNREIFEIQVAEPESTDWEMLEAAAAGDYPLQTKLPSNFHYCQPVYCPPRQVLAQIKRAHVRFEHKFHQNISDYHTLRDWDAPWDRQWVRRRAAEQQALHDKLQKKISLKKGAGEFFDQSAGKIKPLFVHDSVHKELALPQPPAYTLFQTEEVYCDRSMFEAMPYEERVRAVVEEAQVLAIERILAPVHLQGNWFNLPARKVNPDMAFHWGLMRVCTTITSGWFRTFAIEHWPAAIYSYDREYWDKFLAIKDRVPLYERGVYAKPERFERTPSH